MLQQEIYQNMNCLSGLVISLLLMVFQTSWASEAIQSVPERYRFRVLPGTMTWSEAAERCARQSLILAPAAASKAGLAAARSMLARDGVTKRLWIDGRRQHRQCSCDWEFYGASVATTAAIDESSSLTRIECLTLTAPDDIGFADCSHYQAGALCAEPPMPTTTAEAAQLELTTSSSNLLVELPSQRAERHPGGDKTSPWLPVLLAALIVCLLVIAGLLAVIAGQRSAFRARVRHAQSPSAGLNQASSNRQPPPRTVSLASEASMTEEAASISAKRIDDLAGCSSCDMTASSSVSSKISTLTSARSRDTVGARLAAAAASATMAGQNGGQLTQNQQQQSVTRCTLGSQQYQQNHQQQVIQNLGIHVADEGPCEMKSLYDSAGDLLTSDTIDGISTPAVVAAAAAAAARKCT